MPKLIHKILGVKVRWPWGTIERIPLDSWVICFPEGLIYSAVRELDAINCFIDGAITLSYGVENGFLRKDFNPRKLRNFDLTPGMKYLTLPSYVLEYEADSFDYFVERTWQVIELV